jgi:hypothetical protein
VAILQETANLTELDFEIVRTDFETQPHLLDLRGLGMFTVSLHLLRLLVVVFTPVNDASYRWVGIRRNLNQVKFMTLRF